MGNVMDVVIAVIVVGAVIFFGALISIGNERQRKAIDLLRREADDYFKQDLRLKRGAAAQAVKIENPATWLSAIFSKAYGETLALTVDHYVTEPDCLVALDSVGRNILFTTVPPDNLKRMSRGHKQSRLGVGHPLMPLRRGLIVTELNILNTTPLFDLELPIAWKKLTGVGDTLADQLWAYTNF
jgi:hypothetical protein